MGGRVGGRAGRQADRQMKCLQLTKFLKFDNLNCVCMLVLVLVCLCVCVFVCVFCMCVCVYVCVLQCPTNETIYKKLVLYIIMQILLHSYMNS